VERLISEMHSQFSHIFPRKPPAKAVFLCPAESIEELPGEMRTTSPNFGLLLLMDATGVKNQEILQSGARLVERGLAYLCTWGPECERVHDLFDEAAAVRNEKLSSDDVIMTTWHSGETLTEALWFFFHAAFPTQFFEANCLDWIIAPIHNRSWEQEVRTKAGELALIHPAE